MSARIVVALYLALALVGALLVTGCRGESGPDTSSPPIEIVELGDPVEPGADDGTPAPIRGDTGLVAEPVGELPAEYRFVERSGREMTFADLRGQFAVVDFIFTSCSGPCPPMMERMGGLQERLAGVDDVRLVSISVDPQTDTPDVLAEYADGYGADAERWLFARMPIGFVNELTRAELKVGDGGNPLAHSMKFILIDREGRARGYYDPLADTGWIEKLLADLDTLRGEGS